MEIRDKTPRGERNDLQERIQNWEKAESKEDHEKNGA